MYSIVIVIVVAALSVYITDTLMLLPSLSQCCLGHCCHSTVTATNVTLVATVTAVGFLPCREKICSSEISHVKVHVILLKKSADTNPKEPMAYNPSYFIDKQILSISKAT